MQPFIQFKTVEKSNVKRTFNFWKGVKGVLKNISLFFTVSNMFGDKFWFDYKENQTIIENAYLDIVDGLPQCSGNDLTNDKKGLIEITRVKSE